MALKKMSVAENDIVLNNLVRRRWRWAGAGTLAPHPAGCTSLPLPGTVLPTPELSLGILCPRLPGEQPPSLSWSPEQQEDLIVHRCILQERSQTKPPHLWAGQVLHSHPILHSGLREPQP